MNRLIIVGVAVAIALGIAATAPAEPAGSGDVVLTTLFSDGSTNTWTQADLIAALQLLNRKYHRDVSTSSGRAAWHGRIVAESIDTNTLTKVERHEDGTAFTFPARIVTPLDSAKAQLAKLPKRAETNGVPVALAAARERFARESGTVSNVTIRIEAGK